MASVSRNYRHNKSGYHHRIRMLLRGVLLCIFLVGGTAVDIENNTTIPQVTNVVDRISTREVKEKLQQFQNILRADLQLEYSAKYIRHFNERLQSYKYIRHRLKLLDAQNTSININELENFFNPFMQLPISLAQKETLHNYARHAHTLGYHNDYGGQATVTRWNGVVIKRMNPSYNHAHKVQREVLLGMISHFYYPDLFVLHYGYFLHDNQFYILTKEFGTDIGQIKKSDQEMNFVALLTKFYNTIEEPLFDLYIAHNDIKIDNTFIRSAYDIVLGDFGAASFYGYTTNFQRVLLRPGQRNTLGTAGYREIYRWFEVTNDRHPFYLRMLAAARRNDAYALGLSAYKLLVNIPGIDTIRRFHSIRSEGTILFRPTLGGGDQFYKAKVQYRDKGKSMLFMYDHRDPVSIFSRKVKLQGFSDAVKQDLFTFIKNESKVWKEIKRTEMIPAAVVKFIDDTVSAKWKEFIDNYETIKIISTKK